MFGFIKKAFFAGLSILSTLMGANSLSCISMTDKEWKVGPKIINVNSDEPAFSPFSIKTSKCCDSCNNINDPYAKICVPDVAKNLNVGVFNIMSRTNETRNIEWHEKLKYKCRLDASVCNNKKRWNDDKCRCQCKEVIDKGVCDKGSNWNPSNYECECDKLSDVCEYLDYENCKCRKKLFAKLVDECTENTDEVKIAEVTLTENMRKCSSCIMYIMLFSIIFTINVGISTYFVYYKYINCNKENVSRYDYVY